MLPSTKPKNAYALAEKFRKSIESSIPSITISIGVGFLSKEHSIRESLKNIDEALYNAKNNGRNQVWMAENKKVHT